MMRIWLGLVRTVLPVLPVIAVLCLPGGVAARGQETPQQPERPAAPKVSGTAGLDGAEVHNASADLILAPEVQELLAFRDADVRFRLPELMEVLRDRRHEGWVLTAYPDPKTKRPLIGAGFSLDLPEREHLQRDPLNPHAFLEPSSEQLWQAAGMPPAQLHKILEDYQTKLSRWGAKRFRRNIGKLTPQITEEEATGLLRVAAIQAVENARAYCRRFDELTASQQMALSQLVYQMGVNLEEFSQFLTLINREADSKDTDAAMPSDLPATGSHEYWSAVQGSLVQSQWARLYRARAVTVIAMLDPRYAEDPPLAEKRIAATLHPAVGRRHRSRHAPLVRTASEDRHSGAGVRKTHAARSKRKA